MQLKIQRSQRANAFGSILFCLDVRADYSQEERANINRYKLGGQVIYNSQTARKHLETAGAHLDKTQSGGAGQRAAGLARGALSLAMAKMSLNISLASLGRGHHIECKDLEELLEAEDTVREACKGVTRFLQVAETFDGSEVVIEYQDGEERVHITHQATPLLIESSPAPADAEATPAQARYDQGDTSSPAMESAGRFFGDIINQIETKLGVSEVAAKLIFGGGVLFVLFLLYEIL